MGRTLVCYVAGPLGERDGWHETVPEAVLAGDRLMAHEAIAAYVPHAHGATWARYVERDYEWWMQHCFAVLSRCHAVLRIPGHSPGGDREVAHAKRLGIPVFHAHADVYAWADRFAAHTPCAREGGPSHLPSSQPGAAPPQAPGDVVATGRKTVAPSTADPSLAGGDAESPQGAELLTRDVPAAAPSWDPEHDVSLLRLMFGARRQFLPGSAARTRFAREARDAIKRLRGGGEA